MMAARMHNESFGRRIIQDSSLTLFLDPSHPLSDLRSPILAHAQHRPLFYAAAHDEGDVRLIGGNFREPSFRVTMSASLGGDRVGGGIVGGMAMGDGTPLSMHAAASAAEYGECLSDASSSTVFLSALTADGYLTWIRASSPGAAARRALASSLMSSMLRDKSRVRCYSSAVAAAVAAEMAATASASLGGSEGSSAFSTASTSSGPAVLDVGAGTGLLSLQAARAGARAVDAAEQWPPLAAVARRVIAKAAAAGSRGASAITVHSCHSGALSPLARGPAEVVVSEILDSALLGEGVLPALRDTFARLTRTTPPPSCVPAAATVYAQLVCAPVGSGAYAASWSEAHASASNCVPVPPMAGPTDASQSLLHLARRDWGKPCEAVPCARPVHVRALLPAPLAASPVFEAAKLHFTPAGVRLLLRGSGADDDIDGDVDDVSLAASAAAASPNEAPPTPARQLLAVPALPSSPSHAATAVADALLFWWRATLWREPSAAAAVGSGNATEYCTCAECVQTVQGWQDHWVQMLVPLPRPVYPAAAASFPAGARAASCYNDPQALVAVAASVPLNTASETALPRVGCCPVALGAPARSAPVGPENLHFLVSVDVRPLLLAFQVAPGGAEVWPTKRARARALKAAAVATSEAETEAAASAAIAGTPMLSPVSLEASATACIAPLFLDEDSPPCTCGLHAISGWERRWALADGARSARLAAGVVAALRAARESPGAALRPLLVASLGHGAVAGLIAALSLAGEAKSGGPGGSLLAIDDAREAAVHAAALASELEIRDGAWTTVLMPPSWLPPACAENTEAEALSEAQAHATAESDDVKAVDALDAENDDVDVTADPTPPSTLAELVVRSITAAAVAAGCTDGAAPPLDALVIEPVFSRLAAHPLACAVAAWCRVAALRPLLRQGAPIFPASARICAQAVWLRDLPGSHGPVGAVDGLDHSAYDDAARHWHAQSFVYALRDYVWAPASPAVRHWAHLDFGGVTASGCDFSSCRGSATFSADLDISVGRGGGGGGGGGGGSSCGVVPGVVGQEEGPGVACAHAVLFWVEYDDICCLRRAGSSCSGCDSGVIPVLSTHPLASPHSRQILRFLSAPARVRTGARLRVRFVIANAAQNADVALDSAEQADALTFDVSAEEIALSPPS